MIVKSDKYLKRAEAITNHLTNVYNIDTDEKYIQMVDENAIKERVLYKTTSAKLTKVDLMLIKTTLKGVTQ